jgi:hypothetical protein
LDVEDVCDIQKPDERSVMTYVAEYFHAFSALGTVFIMILVVDDIVLMLWVADAIALQIRWRLLDVVLLNLLR